jgi:hypothetical protein
MTVTMIDKKLPPSPTTPLKPTTPTFTPPAHKGGCELVDLTFLALRAYRSALQEENDKIGYWMRVVERQIAPPKSKAVRRTYRNADDMPVEFTQNQLLNALDGTFTGETRTSLMRVHHPAVFPLPPDFDLTPEESKHALKAYHHHIKERLTAATDELISRYNKNPELALDLLKW